MQAFAQRRPDGRYNFVVGNLTLAVIDETTLNGLGYNKSHLLSPEGAEADVFGALALAAVITDGRVSYINDNVCRIFGEQ